MAKYASDIRSATKDTPLSDKQRDALVSNVAGINLRSFVSAFRAVKPGYDEMLATEQTYTMALGINSLKPKKENKEDMQNFMNLNLEMSHAARVKTQHVGYHYLGNQMQHSTVKGQGLFQIKQGKHNQLDRQRAQSTLVHVDQQSRGNDALVPIHLIRSSMINTTNQMMAPTTVSNQTLNSQSTENPQKVFGMREQIKILTRSKTATTVTPTQKKTA